MNVLPLQEATSRLRADHELLLARVAPLTETQPAFWHAAIHLNQLPAEAATGRG